MTINDESIVTTHSSIGLHNDDLSEHIGPLWTVEDVADYLKLQPETIRCMARRGELPALKIGKVWRFERRAIREMLVNMV